MLSGTQVAVAEDLGIIQVESTTIDDRFDNKRNEPSNIAVISGEEVDANHPKNIQQILQQVPGVTTEVQSGDSLKIHIRGVENQVYMGEKPGVAVVIDGVPVFERTGRVNVDLDNIESIKVVKGGASYLFGDDALSGAVIITTKRGADMAGYTVQAEAGSFGYRKGLARAGFAGEKGSGHVQVSRRETDGYHDDSASEADYLNGKMQYYLSDTSDLTFGFELSNRKKNSHGNVKGVTAAEEDPKSEDPSYNDYANHYDVDLSKYFLTYSNDIGETSNWMVNAYQFTDDTVFVTNPTDEDPEVYTYDNDYHQVQRGVKSEFRTGGDSVAWMAGVDLRDNIYENRDTYRIETTGWDRTTYQPGDPHNFNDTDEKVQALYGEVKVQAAERLTVTTNGRVDRIELEYEDKLEPELNGKEDFDVGSWRLGGNYSLRSNLDLYANASTGFRAPSPEQLFVGSNSPSHRTAANPDLDPETTVNKEIGVRAKSRWLGVPVDFDAAIFQLDRYDHIRSTGGQYSTSADAVYDNVGDFRSRGLELSLMTDPSRKVSMDLAYTYLDSTYTNYDEYHLRVEPIDGSCAAGFTPIIERGSVAACDKTYDNAGNKVPRVSDHHLNLRAFYRPASHWLVTGEMDAISSYYADEINELKIDGHEVFNLLVNYDRESWSFFARVDNVLDEQFYNTVRGTGDGNEDGVYDEEDLSIVVNPGRTYYAGATLRF
ncbi:iron complex outermembrane recepter protein [Thiohalomonas denitrificans]|uniref:Iron complex outermembrane recepter protein n=2 Tax=Thiohalomonas denitrificans TaxID=415747 RepID=A0A1G5PJ28_9GAMM|nr:iron complex outermembrane recepter protein [Thiohalomonas denitrificans]